MNNVIPKELEGFTIAGTFLYQDADSTDNHYFYIPAHPQPQFNRESEPDINIEVSDDGANIQLAVQWAANEAERKQLLSRIASEKRLPSEQISLSVGAFNQPDVYLTIGDGRKTVQALQPVLASATEPFQSEIQQILTATEKGYVLSAFNGETGHLMVTYNSLLHVKASIKACIRGDLVEDIHALIPEKSQRRRGWLDFGGSDVEKEITIDDCQAQMERSLESRRLIFSHQSSSNVPRELRQRVDQIVKEKIANLLLEKVNEAIAQDVVPIKCEIEQSHSETQTMTYPIERTADVGNWFKDINGTTHIKEAIGSIASPERKGESDTPAKPRPGNGQATPPGIVVSLDFPPKDFHDFNNNPIVRTIDIVFGGQKQTLQGPDFAPITLPLTATGKVTIETHFMLGQSFTQEVEVSKSELILTPALLGVTQFVVDGSAFKRAQARQANIQVSYLPTSGGARERRNLRFQVDDEEWVKRWFVITRSTDLGGVIQWSWNVQLSSSRSEKQGQTKVNTSHLVLQQAK